MIIAMLVAINIPDTPHPKKSSSKISLHSQHSLTEQGMYHIELETYHLLYTVKPVLSGHLKIDKTKVLMEIGSLMKVESIAECSPWSILKYF